MMSNYETSFNGKNIEELLLEVADAPWWNQNQGAREQWAIAIRVRTTQALVVTQTENTKVLTASIDTLVKSLNKASDDSGKLGRKVVWLTVALVCVGVGQIVATAWPYLSYWAKH